MFPRALLPWPLNFEAGSEELDRSLSLSEGGIRHR